MEPSTRSSISPLQLAIVGAGGMMQYWHLPAVQAAHHGRIELAALVDPDHAKREHARRTFGPARSCASVAGQGDAYPTVAHCLRTVELSEAIREGRSWPAEERE